MSEPGYDFLDLSFLEHCIPSPINSHIFQPFKYLNVQGLYFLDGFIANVAKKFSIGHESSNYILKTFYQLSEEHEAVSYALAAWGGIFIEGGFTENVNHFLGEAIFKMSQEYPNLNNISKKMFIFYSITIWFTLDCKFVLVMFLNGIKYSIEQLI